MELIKNRLVPVTTIMHVVKENKQIGILGTVSDLNDCKLLATTTKFIDEWVFISLVNPKMLLFGNTKEELRTQIQTLIDLGAIN